MIDKKGLLPLAITVLHHGGVLHKGDISTSLHQAPEGAGVPVEVLHRVPEVHHSLIFNCHSQTTGILLSLILILKPLAL